MAEACEPIVGEPLTEFSHHDEGTHAEENIAFGFPATLSGLSSRGSRQGGDAPSGERLALSLRSVQRVRRHVVHGHGAVLLRAHIAHSYPGPETHLTNWKHRERSRGSAVDPHHAPIGSGTAGLIGCCRNHWYGGKRCVGRAAARGRAPVPW